MQFLQLLVTNVALYLVHACKLVVYVITIRCFTMFNLFTLYSVLSEIDAGPIPLPNDKALKEKKRKLKETLDRMLRLYVSHAAIRC